MKIAVLGLRGFPDVLGGVETHCEHLYPRIARLGGKVTVFTRKCYMNPAIRRFEGVDLVPVPCPRRKSLEAVAHTFLAVLRAGMHRPDIIHIHAVGPALFAPLARLLGMRVVMTNHGPDYERKKWGRFARFALKTGERLGSRFANEIICVSPYIAARTRERYARPAHCIPNGIEIQEPVESEETLRRFGLEKGKYILSVGRFVPEKGFDDLLKAFAVSRPEGWKLAIAGRADHADGYSRMLQNRASEIPGVVLTGFLSGAPLREIFSHAGLFALPSYHEGLPIALLEAMSFGLSCVVSDIPANRSVGLPEERYFPPGDISALSARVAAFAADPPRAEYGKRQIETVREKYNWDAIARQTWNVYRKAAGAMDGEENMEPIPSKLVLRMLNYGNPRSRVIKRRIRRLSPLMEMIQEIYHRRGRVEIIDIGGERRYWNLLSHEFLEENNVFITIVNLPDSLVPEDEERFRYVAGDGCSLGDFPDKSFDIVHSNSVIEHVGEWDRMVRFSSEISRLADRYFVQTPNYWFPVEPHFVALFFHWLPKPLQAKLAMKFNLGYMCRQKDLDSAMRAVESIHLLNKRMFRELFKNAELQIERFFFLPKSFIAVKR